MTNRFPRLQLPNETLRERATTSTHNSETAGMAAKAGNPVGAAAPNAAPTTKSVAPGGSLRATKVVAPAKVAAAGAGPSAAPACTNRKILKIGRNRASPARLFKLNKLLNEQQRALIVQHGWGGMLMVKASEMPVDLSMWVLLCYDPVRSELVIEGRGSIPVDAESFHRVFALPNKGLPVVYDMETEPISFMNEMYNIEGGSAPEFKQWCTMIKGMNGVADLKFLRAYFAAVISCFISPSTKCSISPRCYPSIIDLDVTRRSNWCKFAIDQINAEVKKMGVTKNSVCCCLHHLVILYLDSLEVDEPVPSIEDCPIRAAAWDDKLIQAVMRKDMKPNGEFGKLRLKDGVGVTIRDGLFVGMTRTEEFISSKLPRDYPREKKRKLAVMIGELCTDISSRLGMFVEQLGDLEQEESRKRSSIGRTSKRQRSGPADEFSDGDDEYNGDEDEEEVSDNEDEDPQDEDDNDGAGDAAKGPSNAQGREDEDFEDRGTNLEKMPRRSPRFTRSNKSSSDIPMQRSIVKPAGQTGSEGTEDIQHGEDNITAQGLMHSTEVRSAPQPDMSPFSELRQFVSTESTEDINIPSNEPTKIPDFTEKIYPNAIFMEDLLRRSQQASPQTPPPLDQFRRDGAVQNLQAECIAQDNLVFRGEQEWQRNMKQKTLVHRGRQSVNTVSSPETVHQGLSAQPERKTATPSNYSVTGQYPRMGTRASPTNLHQVPFAKSPASTYMPASTNQGLYATNSNRQATYPTGEATGNIHHYRPAQGVVATPLRSQGIQTEGSNCRPPSVPTRQSCPPPQPKSAPPVPQQKSGPPVASNIRSERWKQACDPPPFDLGFDSPVKETEQRGDRRGASPPSVGITPVNLNTARFDEYDDGWSTEMEKEAVDYCCLLERQKGLGMAEDTTNGIVQLSVNEAQTPTTDANQSTANSEDPGSTSAKDVAQRRIIRPPACLKSPYIDYSKKNTYACSADVKDVYAKVTAHAKRSARGQPKDTSPIIVNFEKYFVSLQELANSMMPYAELMNTVVELGLESIMLHKDTNDKRVVMPLRIGCLLLNGNLNDKELKKHFSKKDAQLDRKDMVMLTVMEDLSNDPTVPANHYWVFVANIKGRRFEVLDSMRTIVDKRLAQSAEKLRASFTTLWKEHYSTSRIKIDKFETDMGDIFAPKQGTIKDCGVHALFNVEHWKGRSLPHYGPEQIPNIRKLMTHQWVCSTKNSIKWREAIKKK